MPLAHFTPDAPAVTFPRPYWNHQMIPVISNKGERWAKSSAAPPTHGSSWLPAGHISSDAPPLFSHPSYLPVSQITHLVPFFPTNLPRTAISFSNFKRTSRNMLSHAREYKPCKQACSGQRTLTSEDRLNQGHGLSTLSVKNLLAIW